VATLLAQLLILTYEGINQAAHGELDAAWRLQFDGMLDDHTRILSGVGLVPSEEE
jgi:hypothetical protein